VEHSATASILFDQDQKDAREEVARGMAVGIHVRGLDTTNNLGFLLKQYEFGRHTFVMGWVKW
jgi:hypothetical protein